MFNGWGEWKLSKQKTLLFILVAFWIVTLIPNVPEVEATPTRRSSSTVGLYVADWNLFWQTFRAFSSWDLEWHDGVSWVSRKSDLQIVRDYPEPNHVKITLVFDASENGDYRLTFAIDRRVKKYVQKTSQYQYNLTYDGFSVVFDWSDVLTIPNLQISHGILNNKFWFRLRRDNVPQGAHVEIDPSIMGTSTADTATSFPQQRKGFYATTRYWVAYSNGTHIIYKTSLDGSTWSSGTLLGAGTTGGDFSWSYNGTYVHYVRRDVGGSTFQYRCGEPNSTGLITWDAVEQTVITFTTIFGVATVAVDSQGYPFVSYFNGSGADYRPYVTKSQWNNGSWSTDSGFPYNLTSGGGTLWWTVIVPLTSQRMYALYNLLNANPIYGRLWNGTGWESEETIASSSHFYSAVAYNDDVHLTYVNGTTYELVYNSRTYGSGWGTEEAIVTGLASNSTIVLSVDSTTGNLVAVWAGASDTIYSQAYVGSVWQSTITWITEANINTLSMTCFYEMGNNMVGLLYTQGAGSPYNVKFSLSPANYVLYGPYNENTGLPDNTGVNVTVYFGVVKSPETFLLNGTTTAYYPLQPTYFLFNFTNERQYWLSDTETNTTIYVFTESTTVYTISFLDLAGALDTYPFVEAQRYVNGTLHTIEKRKVDKEDKVTMSLINGQKYNIVIEDGSTYTFGDLLVTSTTSIQLTLKGLEFPQNIILGYKYVRIYAFRVFGASGTGNITVTYQDTLLETTDVDIYIRYENGSNAYNATETANSFIHTWTSASNHTNYYVYATISHQRFGALEQQQYLPRAWSQAPWSLAILGTMPFATNTLIPIFLLLFTAGVFSALTVPVAGLGVMGVATLITYWGWISITPESLVAGWAFAIIIAIIWAKRRVSI